MTKFALVIESSGKIATLQKYLGPDWLIVASGGHIRDLPEKGDIGFTPPDFKPKYELSERGHAAVARIRRAMRQTEEVFLATDPDREGESIAWHIKDELKLPNPKRITFANLTEPVIKAAVATPRPIDLRLVAAQEARRVLDRMVGFLVSPEVAQRTDEATSAGRVQTPAVVLVVERERAIRNFRKTTHFGAELTFCDGSTKWRATWRVSPDFVTDDFPYFLDRGFAESIAGIRQLRVRSAEEKAAWRPPPPPLITASLQQACSVRFGMSPDATMKIAQSLYDQGHISYHRTDNPNIAPESMDELRAVLTASGLGTVHSQREWKVSDAVQAGHPAITPAHWEVEAAGQNEQESAVYELIRITALACQMPAAEYRAREICLEADSAAEERIVKFEGRGRSLVEAGWLRLIDGDATHDDDEPAEESANPIPLLRAGDMVRATAGTVTTSETKAPRRFTEASLVKELERNGVGRPATYAAILSTIQDRGYVRVSQRILKPTPAGEELVDLVAGRFQFADLSFTSQVEKELDQIAQGKTGYLNAVASFHERLIVEIAGLKAAVSRKPSEAMLKAVEAKATREGRVVTAEMRSSREVCEAFLGPRAEKAPGEAPATEKQISVLRRAFICGIISKPDGFPEGLTAKAASELIAKIARPRGRRP